MTASDHPTATPFDGADDQRAGREPIPNEAASHDPHGTPMAEGLPGSPPRAGDEYATSDRGAGPGPAPGYERPAGDDRGFAPASGPVPGSPTHPPATGEPQASTPDDRRPGGERAGGDELFHGADLSGMRGRWDDVQAAFVDNPRDSVQKADALVLEVVEQVTRQFSEARSRLESQWSRGEQVSTEDLRLALQRYREFFQRLLSV